MSKLITPVKFPSENIAKALKIYCSLIFRKGIQRTFCFFLSSVKVVEESIGVTLNNNDIRHNKGFSSTEAQGTTLDICRLETR